jgi:nitroreductase
MPADTDSAPMNQINFAISAVIRGRRTIGSFRPDVPSKDVVLEALDLARWAPNHKKTEPWHAILLGPETAKAVVALNAKIITAAKGAAEAESKTKKWAQVPGWIVITCDQATDPLRREEDYAACCCAIQNLQLALWSAGIGTKWSTGDVTRHPDFYSLLGIDSSQQSIVGLVWYGYPAVVPEQTRGPMEAFLRELP